MPARLIYRKRTNDGYNVYQGSKWIGTVRQERHQSPRTHATGWRWFAFAKIHGALTAQKIPTEHGWETRAAAGAAIVQKREEKR